jgi:hypothetical protein
MAINFNSFSDKSSFSLTDKIVGFDSASPNGEKKWTYSTLLKSVSADIPAVKNVADSSTVNLHFTSSTGTLSASTNGFLYVPLNDPTDPLNNNSGVQGTNVISFAATGNTSATPYTGATQTANLASIVPNNAYMVLVRLETSNNTNETDGALTGEVYVYIRKNTSDAWRLGIFAETLFTVREANEVDTFPLIFDRGTKTFQAYLYHAKGSAPSSNPSYSFSVNVLGYFIK